MANINLATGDVVEKSQSKERMLNSGMIIVVIVFLLVVGVFVVELWYKNYLTSKITETRDEYNVKFSALTGAKAKEVVDFKNRLASADKLMTQGRNAPQDFSFIEKTILPEVRLTKYTYDANANTLKLTCVTNDYNSLARQILSFKKSDNFSAVEIGKTGRDEKGENIIFDITLTLK